MGERNVRPVDQNLCMTPPHPARPFVLLLIEQGIDDATIVASVRMLGLAISERTVRRIRHGEKRTDEKRDGSMNLLNAGERRLAEPARCPRLSGQHHH